MAGKPMYLNNLLLMNEASVRRAAYLLDVIIIDRIQTNIQVQQLDKGLYRLQTKVGTAKHSIGINRAIIGLLTDHIAFTALSSM
jgi:hypothetical protein